MKGSLQTKNNIYYTVLSIKDKNGKFRTKWQTTGLKVKGNKRRAEAILQQRIAEYEETANPNPAKIPFAEFQQRGFLRHSILIVFVNIFIL